MNFQIKHILPATDRSIKIEQRLFEIILVLTIAVFIFWTIYGFVVGYEYFVQTVYSSGIVIYSVIYFLQKKGVAFRKLSITYYYLALFLIGISWFPAGGITTAIPTFLGLVYLAGLLVLPLKDYLIFIIITFGMVLGLIVYEINDPSMAAPYQSDALLTQDIAIATLTSLAIMGVCLYIFKRTYIDDRRLLRQKNLELEKEKQRAESTDQAKTTFLATISHEMRTPLNGIVGMTELLAKTNVDKEQEELIESLNYSSNILHGLISNVLDITTIEAGKLELSMGSFSLAEELTAVWKVFEKKAASNPNLEIKLELDTELPKYVTGDVSRIRQVLVNLMNNATKFTWKGSIILSVRVLGKTGDVCSIEFSIKDTGAGIPPEKQDHLFETFYKASEHEGYEGSGLGLAIVEKLVTLMGGNIAFESKLNEGSHFYFTLPLGIASEDEMGSLDRITVPGLDHLRILIVEDIEINRMVATKMLLKMNIQDVDLAFNGTEGVNKAKEKFYNIIFMDLQMPDISGFEASRQITEFYKEKENKPIIIALTANAMKSSVDDGKKVGMSDYLLKPIKTETLKQVLMKYASQ